MIKKAALVQPVWITNQMQFLDIVAVVLIIVMAKDQKITVIAQLKQSKLRNQMFIRVLSQK